MKNKNLSNVIFVISMLIFTGIGAMMVVRNIPFGLAAVLLIGAINALVVILLLAAANGKKKWWAVICRIVVIGWLIYAFIGSSTSTNEDAILFATIYTIAGVVAIVFGVLRHKMHDKDS
ncbi:MAG: hypothetical protein FWE12_00490 [Oscillospiraceae bacterium]|nr:hypothetical protein [Oscillospiraceae bacterium]